MKDGYCDDDVIGGIMNSSALAFKLYFIFYI